MLNPLHAFIVDDEDSVCLLLARTLEFSGYITQTAPTGEDALTILRDTSFDVLIVDLHLGGRVSGLQVVQAVRWRWPETIVIILTGYATLESAIQAIEEGVDGYLQKPVEPERLRQAIADAQLRRQKRPAATASNLLHIGPFQLDLARHLATCDDIPLALTPTEFALLAFLLQNTEQVHPPRTLVQTVQGYACETDREARELIKWHVHKLRQKIEPDPAHPQFLHNVRGVGYILKLPPS